MRAKVALVALGIVCGLVLAVVSLTLITQFRFVAPTADTQSAFIKSYNPKPLIERFACGNIVASSTGGLSNGGGIGFNSSHRNISADIEIDEQHWIPLMQALATDIDNQLLLGGSAGAGAGKGMTSSFYYQDGRILGSVTIPPLVPYDWIAPIRRNYPRQAGCTPVQVSIYIDEVFIPKLPLDAVDQASRITNRADRQRHHAPEVQRELQVIYEHPEKR